MRHIVLLAHSGQEIFRTELLSETARVAMAIELYNPLWYPSRSGIKTAEDLRNRCRLAVAKLKESKGHYVTQEKTRQFIKLAESILWACRDNPGALVVIE